MTALNTPPEETIKQLQRLLRESYEAGFPILKELIQNADDAGATRLRLQTHSGFTEASNPLLRAPSLIVVNDGAVNERDLIGMAKASGGSKAGDAATVGRFGLGQKSVFHLCDAFVVQAWLEDKGERRTDVINPFELLEEATAAREDWPSLDDSDKSAILRWAIEHQFDRHGAALILPLRHDNLSAGGGLKLHDKCRTADQAISEMLESPVLPAALACMRSLEVIEIVGSDRNVRRYHFRPSKGRLSPPKSSNSGRVIGGVVEANGARVAVTGRESWSPNEQAMAIKADLNWPSTWNHRGQQQPEEAEPHAAVMLCHAPGGDDAGKLRLHWTVYLPIGKGIDDVQAPGLRGDVDLLLHGHFFPRSDRTAIELDSDLRGRWNRALLEEGTLPLLLDVLADALPGFTDDSERRALLRALKKTDWWAEYGTAACGDQALALAWDGASRPAWKVVASETLRPLPEALRVDRLKATWPDLERWCSQQAITLAFGRPLGAVGIGWPDADLAAMLQLAGATVFTRDAAAETVVAILEDQDALGPNTVDALVGCFRDAIEGEANFARKDIVIKLARQLPAERLLPLPSSVTNRAIMRAIAGVGGILPLRDEWRPDLVLSRLNVSIAIDLLIALEPFFGTGSTAEQAGAVVNLILANGPTLSQLASQQRADGLAVVPARRLRDKADVRLTISETANLAERGLLFKSQPGVELDELAEAVTEPVIHRVPASFNEAIPGLATIAKPHLLRVLLQATAFGDAVACAKLALRLRDQPEQRELRSLVARQAEMSPGAQLIELGQISPILEPLLDKLLVTQQDTRVVEVAIARQLGDDQKDAIGIARIDLDRMAGWLRVAVETGEALEIGEDQAVALLKSNLDEELLRQLPLHRTADGELVAVTDVLFQADLQAIPSSLLGHIRLLDPWPDKQAAAKQSKLVRQWSASALLDVALATAEPWLHAVEIAATVTDLTSIDETRSEQIRTTRWVPLPSGPVAPNEFLDLSDAVEVSLRALLPGEGAFRTLGERPTFLRVETIVTALRRHGAFLGRQQSIAAMVRLLEKAPVAGLAIDAVDHMDDLATLAAERTDLAVPGWPLLAAVIRDDATSASALALALVSPDRDGTVAQLNALAEVPAGRAHEAARRLHRAIFKAKATDLQEGGFLPNALQVLTEAGGFAPAHDVARDAQGVVLSRQLSAEYRQSLGVAGTTASRTDPDNPVDSNDFVDALASHLDVRRSFIEPNDALFVMALLARGERIEMHARKWPASRSFGQICEAIDNALVRPDLPEHFLRRRLGEIQLVLRETLDGHALVLSAAGTEIEVPLESGRSTWLVDKIRRIVPSGSSSIEKIELIVSATLPDKDVATSGLLAQLVRGLLPVLHLQFNNKGSPLLGLLESVSGGDRETLEDTREELRQVIHDRLRTFRNAPGIKRELDAFDEAPKRNKAAAHNQLWSFVQTEAAAPKLLAAVRGKIADMGYADARVLFELFQNADDALAYHHPGDASFRVIAERDGDQVGRLRIVHFGRPINTAGNTPEPAPGHRRDLANMIAIGHSEKEDEKQTGRFGLGFKTVHMLSDGVGVASGAIATRISGGMIPLEWNEGAKEAAFYNSDFHKPTLIDLPIAPGREANAARAWEAFKGAAPWLAAIAPRIETVILDDGGQEVTHDAKYRRLIDGVFVVTLRNGRRTLRFDLDHDFRLFLAFGVNGPEGFGPDVRQFWHLVPLDGIVRRGDWLLEGRFDVDPGRTQFSGSAEVQEARFVGLGSSLGARLIALHDAVGGDEGWATFAADERLAPDGLDDFWARLTRGFAKDLIGSGPEGALHRQGGGVARLLSERPLVPLAGGGFGRAGAIKWTPAGALSYSVVRDAVSGWPGVAEILDAAVAAEFAVQLGEMGFATMSIDLGGVIARVFSEKLMTPLTATALGPAVGNEVIQWCLPHEEAALRQFLRDALWIAEDGSHQPIRLLAFPQSGSPEEVQRAAFAPAAGRLAAAYVGDAFVAASFAREQAGSQSDAWLKWAMTAGADEARRTAFLCYLAEQDADTIRRLAEAASWLAPLAELAKWQPLLQTPGHQMILAALTVFPEPDANDTIDVKRTLDYAPDPMIALELIKEWWAVNRHDLAAQYDNSVYPEDFQVSRLLDGEGEDDQAWFTMLALATFQTLGRIQPEASRGFVETCTRDGWWRELATVHHKDDLKPFYTPLKVWSEPDSDETFMLWRRCLIDLCRVARYLPGYRKLFRKLPAIVKEKGRISLSTLMRPGESADAAHINVDAAPIARSLGIGANWMVRELCRHNVYSAEQTALVAPYGWSSVERVRRLYAYLGRNFEHGIDVSSRLHEVVTGDWGFDTTLFRSDGDLPLHIITRSRHVQVLDEILRQACARRWETIDADDD